MNVVIRALYGNCVYSDISYSLLTLNINTANLTLPIEDEFKYCHIELSESSTMQGVR